jgi:hypothetical protein
MVGYICNPSYSGGKNRRITAPGQAMQKLARPYFKNKPVVVGHDCGLSYSGSGGRRITV